MIGMFWEKHWSLKWRERGSKNDRGRHGKCKCRRRAGVLVRKRGCIESSKMENGNWKDCCQSGINLATLIYRDKRGSKLELIDWLISAAGNWFKKTRYLAVRNIDQFSRNSLSNQFPKNMRSLFKNFKQLQLILWVKSRNNCPELHELLVKFSDWSSFLRPVPGCWVSKHVI